MNERSIVTQSNSPGYYNHDISGLDLTLSAAIGMSTLSTIAVLVYVSRSKKQQDLLPPKPPQAMCEGCKYFNDNQFLRCALHPTNVLTTESVDCMDYTSKTKLKQFGKLQKVLLSIQKIFL